MKKQEVEWFFRQITEGDSALDANAINRLSEQLEISLKNRSYFCIAVRYVDSNAAILDIVLPLKLYNACVGAGRSQREEIYCYPASYLSVIMVVADNGIGRDKVANRLYQTISRRVSSSVQMGVGRSLSAEKLSYSRVEALEVLNYMINEAGIAYVEDMHMISSITARKMEREKRRIIEQFKSGQLNTMKSTLTQLAESIREESPVHEGRPYPTSIRRTVVELLAEIMHTSADNGVDVEAVLENNDPYRRVFELNDTPPIIDWCCDIAQTLYSSMVEQRSQSDSHVLAAAKKYIREHVYDPDLSLSMISWEMGMSPSYFSAFFIRETGIGFTEYITSIRIEKAKELLSESLKKINVIAQDCGFMSASYFINVFRKQVGCSPGEYRKRK